MDEAEEIGTPPQRKMRTAGINTNIRIKQQFQSGGALDSQVNSQEFTNTLYEKAGQSPHVQERLEGRPKPRHEPRLPFRDLAAEEEHNHPRAELGTTKAELETTKAELETTKAELEITKAELKATKAELEATKRTLLRAEREAGKWRTAAMKVSAVVERAAKQISNVTEAVDSDQE
ncbi:hypothetical protein B0H13DRAFT_1897893 [Mycena leptocephala]|nr:hypothetical protein B0H13DRAFT_1897893 [Mycena leptocephala]